MNYIQSLTARGLKSGDFSNDLKLVNIITGTSASGKSSRIDAIRLALVGYLPELGKNGTMQLCRNGRLDVSIRDDQNRSNVREWSAKNKTGVELFNEIPETPPVLMEPSLYMGLSDKKKIEYAFSMFDMGASEFNGASITAKVKNIKLEENTEDTEAVIADIVKTISEEDFAREQLETPIQQWIEELIAKMKARVSTAKANCDRMTKTVQGITQVASNQTQYRNPEADIQAERAALSKLAERKGALDAQKKAVLDLTAKREALNKELASIKEPDATLDARIEQLKAEIAALEAKPLALAGTKELQTQLDAINTEMLGYKSQTSEMKEKASEVKIDIASNQIELKNLLNDLNQKTIAYKNSMAVECCTHCGAHHEHWSSANSKAHKIREFDAWKSNQEFAIEKLSGAIETKRLNLEAISEKIRSSIIADQVIETKRQSVNNLWARINEQKEKNENARINRDRSLLGIRERLATLERQKQAESSIVTRRTQANKSLEDIAAELAKHIDVDTNLGFVQADITTVRNRIDALELQKKEYLKAQADQQRTAQALLEHAKAKAELEVTKAAVAVLEEIQSDMVTKAFEKILKTVNRVTDCVIPEPIEYRNGEIGRFLGSTWTTHATFSQTEKGLIFAGISLALSERAPIKVVLIDELGRADDDSIAKILDRMVRLTEEGVMDQFIGCLSVKEFPGCETGLEIRPGFKTPEGVNLIRL